MISANDFRDKVKSGEYKIVKGKITSTKEKKKDTLKKDIAPKKEKVKNKQHTEIELHYLPKLSLNKWYSGEHWTKRKKIKDKYKELVRKQTDYIGTEPCDVIYKFEFKSKPLDASNTIAMVKLIEDILFEDDSYKIILSIKLESRKGSEDKLFIIIDEKR